LRCSARFTAEAARFNDFFMFASTKVLGESYPIR